MNVLVRDISLPRRLPVIYFSGGKSFLLPSFTWCVAPLPLKHTTALDLLCKSPYNGTNRITCEALKNARAVHYICVWGTKKPAVNEASLKQGMASLCCRNGPSLCSSSLSSKLLFLPLFFFFFSFFLSVLFSFALWPLAALFIGAVFQDR